MISIMTNAIHTKPNVHIATAMGLNHITTTTTMKTTTMNQIELFEPENEFKHMVFFELIDHPELDKTRPMTMNECVEFVGFLKFFGYRWRWIQIKLID